MGALGLQGPSGRPQVRGCFLLAVAGATSLVTLLLAVPLTVLAVLALVPQERGGSVSGCSRPRGLGLAHAPWLPGLWPTWLGWLSLWNGSPFADSSHVSAGLHLSSCRTPGSQCTAHAPPAGTQAPLGSVALGGPSSIADSSAVPGFRELPGEAPETDLSRPLPAAHLIEPGPLWYASVGLGGLVQLRRGERVYVNISHPELVDYRRGKTFFGAVMMG
ncbi:Lymphotoxin-beta [Heterocephalus glaber]|uniref:Lymphotoxin-beta n=1 Tax=Heterocephalus glaber TaxID=10181 RepID=G5C3E3_HETGA|nr:Lymphotoxin-beta [Heterocephalus glaber]